MASWNSPRNRQGGARPRHHGTVKWPVSAVLGAFMGGMVLSLMGCAGEETSSDGTSPNHIITAPKSQGKYRFGITDTVSVIFSENIDTAALDVDFADTAGIAFRKVGQRLLQVHGTRKTFGTSHFRVNTDFTMTITGLQDHAGNGHPAIVETFMPYRWADRDFIDSGFTGYDSLFAGDSAWIDGSSLRDTLVVEGALDFYENFGREDRADLKIVRLTAPDTLDVSVTSRSDLDIKLQVAGPFAAEGLEAALRAFVFPSQGVQSRNGRMDTTFHADYQDHDIKLGSPSAPGIYALRLSLTRVDTEGFYRIRLRQGKLRR